MTALLLFASLSLLGAAPSGLAKQQWNGPAICYSGYRQGQDPDKGIFPTRAQVLEDLRILEREWRLIRLYGSDRHSQDVLELIDQEKIRLKVMLGIWLSGKPGKQAENERQVAHALQLARAHSGIVAAINVGNEALVSWSDHRLGEPEVIRFVKQVKHAVQCPVTVADDYLFWSQPGNRLVEHLDFITLHSYPIWGYQDIDKALATTVEKFEDIRRAYPGKTVVFGEVGWASYTEGPKHVPGAGDEAKQKRYYEEVSAWARSRGVTVFFFEAFDEPWKGRGTEGHWGLFSVDRKAKLVMQDHFRDLLPSQPTSPAPQPASSTPRPPDGQQP